METSNGKTLGVVAVAIAVIALTFSLFNGTSPAPAPSPTNSDNVGGERAGLQEFFDGVKAGNIGSKWIGKTLPPLANAVLLYRNTSGKDVIIDYGEVNVLTSQTASTSYRVHIFATTSSSIVASTDYTALAEGRRSLIGVTLATSTTATTTNSVSSAIIGRGNGAVLVASDSYVFGYIQNLPLEGGGPLCTGAACETATSSNRGFNPVFNIRIHEGSEGRSGAISL